MNYIQKTFTLQKIDLGVKVMVLLVLPTLYSMVERWTTVAQSSCVFLLDVSDRIIILSDALEDIEK
jgi:hypothetical protein